MLQNTLEAMVAAGTLRHIELQQHELARSNDPALLDFLTAIREEQPTRNVIRKFFGERRLAKDLTLQYVQMLPQKRERQENFVDHVWTSGVDSFIAPPPASLGRPRLPRSSR